MFVLCVNDVSNGVSMSFLRCVHDVSNGVSMNV